MKVELKAEPWPVEIDPQMTTVIVIDMQNACVSKGGMFDLSGFDISNGQKALGPINKLTQASRAIGRRVVYIAHRYSPDFRELGDPDSVFWVRNQEVIFYREHPEWREKLLIRGTWGAEIVDGLNREESDIVVEKTRYSAFWGTNLDVILKTLDTRYLVFSGVVTSGCVEATLRDAFYLGYFTILVSDATGAGTPASQAATTNNVTRALGWVTTSENVIKAMK